MQNEINVTCSSISLKHAPNDLQGRLIRENCIWGFIKTQGLHLILQPQAINALFISIMKSF